MRWGWLFAAASEVSAHGLPKAKLGNKLARHIG
jgi:hypothetical protein